MVKSEDSDAAIPTINMHSVTLLILVYKF